jgi:glutamate-ammonia-ligase adenylyltransferase
MLAGAAAAAVRGASEIQARILTALFSGSQALSEALVQHPDWLAPHLAVEHLQHPRQEQGLRREIHPGIESRLRARDYVGALAHLRQFKQREMLRIAARDLARLGETQEIVREISDVADVCLTAVGRICRQQLQERMGQPFHQDAAGVWQPTQFAVLGLGKLAARS